MTTADDRPDDAGTASESDPSTGPNPGPSTGPDTAPVGGSEASEDELEADNPVEEDTLKTLEGGAPTG